MNSARAERFDSKEFDLDLSHLTGIRRTGGVAQYRAVLSRDPCSYCGVSSPRSGGVICFVDHMHARARGGPNRWWNYTAACCACNRGKLDDFPLGWLLVLSWIRIAAAAARCIRDEQQLEGPAANGSSEEGAGTAHVKQP
ncbi:MAG: HNH endonuclease [Solirubrobacteraceae bacterium]